MGPTIDQEIANLRRGLAAGKVATRDAVTRVIRQLDQLLAKPDADWPLRAPARRRTPGRAGPTRSAAAFAPRWTRAIAHVDPPGVPALSPGAVRDEILPRARDDRHVGLLLTCRAAPPATRG